MTAAVDEAARRARFRMGCLLRSARGDEPDIEWTRHTLAWPDATLGVWALMTLQELSQAEVAAAVAALEASGAPADEVEAYEQRVREQQARVRRRSRRERQQRWRQFRQMHARFVVYAASGSRRCEVERSRRREHVPRRDKSRVGGSRRCRSPGRADDDPEPLAGGDAP